MSDYVSVPAAAKDVGISQRTLYRIIETRGADVPRIKLASQTRYSLAALRELVRGA